MPLMGTIFAKVADRIALIVLRYGECIPKESGIAGTCTRLTRLQYPVKREYQDTGLCAVSASNDGHRIPAGNPLMSQATAPNLASASV